MIIVFQTCTGKNIIFLLEYLLNVIFTIWLQIVNIKLMKFNTRINRVARYFRDDLTRLESREAAQPVC